MKTHQIKFNGYPDNYSIIIGKNVLSLLPKKLKNYVQKLKELPYFDRNVPKKFKNFSSNKLKNIILFSLILMQMKNLNLLKLQIFIRKILENNLNRSDLVLV